MTFTESSHQAAVYLRKAVPKMIQHKIIPNPFNFALWYSYYSQQFPELVQELDYIIDRFDTCPPDMSETLFLKHIIQTKQYPDSVQDVFQQGVMALVDSLTQSIEESAQQSHGFSSALTDSIEKLADCPVQDDIKKVLAELNENSLALCSVVDTFHAGMSAAQSEIQSLKQQLEQVKTLANTDALTGLSNRRMLETYYRQALEVDKSDNISLIMMDIDNFKNFNDTHGHIMGDQVLKMVGRVLVEECASPIIAVRYGGEEFVLLCPDIGLEGALKVSENIRLRLSSIPLSNKRTGNKLPPVTASLGVAITDTAEILNKLIDRADQALYKAKQEGRNRVKVTL
jgi:diguanylate cyclase